MMRLHNRPTLWVSLLWCVLVNFSDTTVMAGGSSPRVVLVVPAYNEELRIPVLQFLTFGNQFRDIHFLFVDDGSTDRTVDKIQLLVNDAPQSFSLLALDQNQGKAEAVRLGFIQAFRLSPTFVGFWDADLATPLDAVNDMLDVFHKTRGADDQNAQIDMVFGARVALLGRHIRRHMLRHYSGRVFATMASTILSLRIYDTQCGAKIFRLTDDLRIAFSRPFMSKWIFDVELIARFVVQRQQQIGSTPMEEAIYEFPLQRWTDIKGSKLKLFSKVKALLGLAQIWFHYFSPWQTWPSWIDVARERLGINNGTVENEGAPSTNHEL